MKVALLGLFFLGAAATAAYAAGESSLSLHEKTKPIPAISFTDEAGEPLTLDDYRGKVVLLNVWATWCAPCRREMPVLERLRDRLGGDSFEVVPLSIDRMGPMAVKRFYRDAGISRLPVTVDRSAAVARQLGVRGIPTTILLGANGRELGRLVGPLEWDTPETTTFLESVIGGASDTAQ